MTRQTDTQIQRLLTEVDRRVGLSRTLIAFTADHGVAPLPEALAAQRIPGGRFKAAAVTDAITAALEGAFGAGPWIEKASLPSVYLAAATIAARGADPAAVRRVAAEAAAGVPHVARVYTRDAILSGAVPRDSASERITRGFHRDRSGDLHVLLEPHWMTAAAGTTHGTPYGYDAHIPLILMGPGVHAGTYHDRVTLLDLAPTLAALLEVEPPSGSMGRVLTEALRRPGTPALPTAQTSGARPTPVAPRTGEP